MVPAFIFLLAARQNRLLSRSCPDLAGIYKQRARYCVKPARHPKPPLPNHVINQAVNVACAAKTASQVSRPSGRWSTIGRSKTP